MGQQHRYQAPQGDTHVGVSDGGPDDPRWAAALCPTCHRQVHHGFGGRVHNRAIEAALGMIKAAPRGGSERPALPDAAPLPKPSNFVFNSHAGTPMHYRNVSRRGLAPAAARAGVNDGQRPNLRFHDLRHTFTSLLVAEGANVVFVSRQLGHASPDITLKVYAHLFDRAAHAERARGMLEASFGKLLESSGGDTRRLRSIDAGANRHPS